MSDLWNKFTTSVQENFGAWFWGVFFAGIVVMIIGGIIQGKMQSTMKKWSTQDSGTGLTGSAASTNALNKRSIKGVSIVAGQRALGDNFNPKTNVVTLSPGILNGSSVAALAVAMHETGHVVQHHKGSAFMKFRNIFLIPAQIGGTVSSSMFSMAFIGILFSDGGTFFDPGYSPWISWMLGLGVLLFSFVVLFQLITIPVEKQASRYALKMMVEDGMIKQGSAEYLGAQECLKSAARTYMVAALMSIAQLIRWLVILIAVKGRGR